jgi:NAD(P)-dependent dehydrogenase (short-subunit alcohol dehydrogenase family)
LIASVSSSGAQEYAWHVAYGVGKCALDRLTADAAHELGKHGVAVVSLWPGLVLTERLEGAAKAGIPGLDFSRAESPRFTGRAVAALAADPDAARWSGRAIPVRELAEAYGFTDVDGRLPGGPLHDRPWRAATR